MSGSSEQDRGDMNILLELENLTKTISKEELESNGSEAPKVESNGFDGESVSEERKTLYSTQSDDEYDDLPPPRNGDVTEDTRKPMSKMVNNELHVNSELQLDVMAALFSGIDGAEVEQTERFMEQTLTDAGLSTDQFEQFSDENDSFSLSQDSEDNANQRFLDNDDNEMGEFEHPPTIRTHSQFEMFTKSIRKRLSFIMKYWSMINFAVWTGFTCYCLLKHSHYIGYILVIWICAVAGQFAIYYHAKAVLSMTGHRVNPYLLFYLLCVGFDLAVRMYFQIELDENEDDQPMFTLPFLVFHMISLFVLSFVFYGEAFEYQPVFSVWNFVTQWFDIGLTFAIPCLALTLEAELVGMTVRWMMYICLVGQTLVWVIPLVAFRLGKNKERICWHIVITCVAFDVPLIGSTLYAIAAHELHTAIGMLFTIKVIIFLRQVSYNIVYTHILDAFNSPRVRLVDGEENQKFWDNDESSKIWEKPNS